MKIPKIISITLALLIIAIFMGPIAQSASNGATVSYLYGKASKSKDKVKGPWAQLKTGNTVSAGYFIKTDPDSRIELTMPDKSKIRIAPSSVLYLSSARFSNGVRNYEAQVESGRVYTKATASQNKDDKFIVKTNGAVAGLRGTAFDTILLPDGSTRVKCLEGKVWVSTFADYVNRAMHEKQEIPTTGSVEPTEVPGPNEVTVDEFIRIVGAMMSVTVGADGKLGDPVPVTENEIDDWETWNQQRDADK